MRIQIAGITSEIIFSDFEFEASVKSRYKSFLVSTKPRIEITVSVTRPVHQDTLRMLQEGYAFPDPIVQIARVGEAYHVERFDNPFKAMVDFSTGKVEVEMSHNLYCFDSFLRVLYSMLLAREEGALLHAAGMKNFQGGYILLGVSESGKTTMANLSEDIVLSDELIAVRRENGAYYVFSTPFWGEFVAGKVSDMARLEAAYLLVKDKEDFVKPIKRSNAVREILGCTLFFGPEDLTASIFDFCVDLACQVPVRELHFRPTREAFSLIGEGVA